MSEISGGEVTIIFENEEQVFEIQDLDQEFLLESFSLDFTPKMLKHQSTQKVIKLPRGFSDLKSGETYVLPGPKKGQQSKKISEEKSLWDKSFLPADLIQNSVIACRAVYKDTDQDCINFLQNNITNHNFEFIFRSENDKHCHFLVAEEIRKDRIYIAFRGSHTAQDWKDNLKSFQTKHLDAVQGKFCLFYKENIRE